MPKNDTKSKLQSLKVEFLEHLEIEKNRSKLTLRNYDLYLSRFLSFAEKENITQPQEITQDAVRKYRLQLNRLLDRRGRELKLITQNYHIIAMRSFLKYLAKRDIDSLAAEKLELAKAPSRQVEFLDRDDLEKLFAATEKENNELTRLRDRAILEMFFSTGLRVAELTSILRKQIDLNKDEFTIKGKGDKIRIVFLSDKARSALVRYLKKRPDNSPALFVRHNRDLSMDDIHPLTARSVQRMIKKYAIQAGISTEITPHTLRHTMATDLLAAGADLRSVQEILGHASITTTQIYTHITNKRLREIHQKYHGKQRK